MPEPKIISREELASRLDNDGPVVIEVLAPVEYEKEHIKGAINIPHPHIVHHAKEMFHPDQEIVVYCSNWDCQASEIAAQKLVDAGFTNVRRYRAGKDAWKEAGLPMESGR